MTIDGAAFIWDLPLDSGTLDDWAAIVEHSSPYVLVNGVPVARSSTIGVPRP